MRVLYFGDTFGRPGRDAVKFAIGKFRAQGPIDFIVVNGENMAHGNGIMPEMAEEFHALGVDVITTGNHAWDKKQIIPFMEQSHWVIRPANYPDSEYEKTPGHGSVIVESRTVPGLKLAVLQIMGRVFMDPLECPFHTADRELAKLRAQGAVSILVDFHAEASSEKQALTFHLDGRVSAVVGSHAHVQTADERLSPAGTAAITDTGMCGCFDSVIGVKKEASLRKFLTKRPVKFEPAEGPAGYSAVLIDIDPKTGRALSIERHREVQVVP